jgi:hypothetical protein
MKFGAGPDRDYLTPFGERLRRHLSANGSRALLGGISSSAVIAGFLSATQVNGTLLEYIGVACVFSAIILLGLAVPAWRLRAFVVPSRRVVTRPGRPRQLELVAARPGAPTRQLAAARCDDPVYGAGLRVLLSPARPLVVIPSNRRDVGREHELTLSLFGQGLRRTRVDVDPRSFGIPLAPYSFERELPEGVQDTDHTLAVKDLIFVPELAALLRGSDPLADAPMMWPEHCVDLAQLAERDVVVVGGPDTNFWHGAMFEPVARQFASPPSSVPLALDLRERSADLPSYGSRTMSVALAGLSSALRHTRQDRAELDERLYPTYGMVLACRNPFAAAIGRSHWCTFVAGTRSLGTSGAVLGLVMMLKAMRDDPAVNFFSEVPTDSSDVRARVSAVLCRTLGVEHSMLRRGNALVPRGRRQLPSQGLDPMYSDSYVPFEVEYLSYGGGDPRWVSLGRLV